MPIRHKFAVLYLTFSLVMLTGCNTLQRIQAGELTTTFDRTFKVYQKHLRWSHFREMTSFMKPEHVGPSMAKIPELSDIKVSRVTPLAWVLNDVEGTMVGEIIIDYYITSTSTIRSTSQRQTWRHDSENDIWQLDNGLPDF